MSDATSPEPTPDEQRLPCPHARPSWRMCPHCLGFAFGKLFVQDEPEPAMDDPDHGL